MPTNPSSQRGDDARRNQIRPVKRRIEDELLAKKNVHGVDIATKVTGGEDTGELAIVVYVEKKGGRLTAEDRVPEEIDGIKTDVQEAPVFRPHSMMLRDTIEIHPDETRYDTLEGGMSIGPCRSIFLEPPDVDTPGNYVFVGTLGCIVRDRSSGDPMMLTNFHVACVDDTWSVGDDITQPALNDGGSCPADEVGSIGRAVLSSNVDGAVLAIDPGRPSSCSILEIGDITGTATVADGDAVRKRGRTTGYTHGTVTSTDYTTSIDYGSALGSITFRDQIRIAVDTSQSTQFGNSGDSGSVVVDSDERVVGLYFAGTSDGSLGVANPIAAVLDELDVDICTEPPKLKEWGKETLKEWGKDFEHKYVKEDLKEFIKEKEKEFKELKEFGKDWKEWAYEKGDWESTPFDPVRPPVRRPVQPPVGRPPIGRRGGAGRFAGALGVSAGSSGGLLIDLTTAPVGDVPNPVSLPGASATVLSWDGTMPALARYVDWGGRVGLDVGFQTSVVLCGDCSRVAVDLTHFSSPATVEAYDAVGNLLDAATMATNGPETLVLDGSGAGIVRLVIDAPQDETLLHRIECVDDCGGTPRPPFREKPPMVEKPPFSDKAPIVEKGWVETPVSPPGGPGRPGPFVGSELRPDLRRGALMHERPTRRAS